MVVNFGKIFSGKWFFSPFKKNEDPIIQKNNDFFKNFNQGKNLEEYSFVVLDTELTGFDPKKDEIVSIGAIKIANLQIIPSDNFYVIVRPKKNELKKDSTLIHRLTPQILEKASFIEEVLGDFIEFCYGSLLVGHFIDLDMSFINVATKRVFGGTLKNPCIDTLRLAIRYKEKQSGHYHDRYTLMGNYSLEEISKENKIPIFNSHNALQDSIQTAYLFLHFIKKLQKKGITTLKDLYLAGKPKLSL